MKKTLFVTLFFLSFSAIAKTTIITSQVVDGKANVVIGFSDSSFDYKQTDLQKEKSFCYIGASGGVCPQIEYAAFAIGGSDRHDRLKIELCETIEISDYHLYEPAKVLVRYNLSDDYGSNFNVERVIEKCTQSSMR